MSLPSPQKEAAPSAAGVSRSFPGRFLNCETEGRGTVREENEHDEGNEAAGAPVAPDTETQEADDAEEAEESERAAHEPGEAPEHDGDEPETAGTQASAKAQRDQQKMIEKMFAAFDSEAKRHSDRVSVIGGESAQDLLPCPMCMPDEGQPRIPGFLLPVKPSDEKIAAIRAAIGLAPKIEYRDDPHSQVCPTCGGLKLVRPTGGDDSTPLLTCVTCNASGWIATDTVRGGVPTNGEVTTAKQTGPLAPPTLEPDSPEVAALKAQGFTVIAPYTMPAA